MFSRKYSCENTKMADKLGYCTIIWESVRQVSPYQRRLSVPLIRRTDFVFPLRYALTKQVLLY